MASTSNQQSPVIPIQFPRMEVKQCNRVRSAHLQFRKSLTPGTGRGLHAEVDAAPGKLLARIQKPLLNIVKKGCIETTCDNCLATHRQGGAMDGICSSTVSSDGISRPQHMVACDGCKFLHYCSEKCKNEAWANHHKAECSVLDKLVKEGWQEDAAIESELLRVVIRLFCLRATGDEYESVFENLKSLPEYNQLTRVAMLCWDSDDIENFAVQCGLLRRYEGMGDGDGEANGENGGFENEGFVQGREDIKHIYIAMETHGIDIAHPKINIDGLTEHHESYIVTGTCFDFCTSKINHSCAPNCIWVFNKSELQLRAVKNIRGGEELTVSYDAYAGAREENYSRGTVKSHWNGNAHKKRVKKLKERWGFECACTLCLGAKYQPFWHTKGSRIDDLVQPLFKKATYPPPQPIDELPKLLRLLTIASEENFSLQSFPMKTIHERICTHQANSRQLIEALRTSLKLYILVETQYFIPLPLDQRLSSLRILSEYYERYTQFLNLPHLTEDLYVRLFGLKLKLVRETEMCFGRDSDIAIFLRKTLAAEIQAVKVNATRTKLDLGLVEVRFAVEMKGMLNRAGFDEEQIKKAKICEIL
ncbi:hypothetical protein DL95DRAFT_522942 [Leptodontidium sp. 2 PMI_412]|nr:hypothetical protein DL95DRAFT_522942 [Leptodontidium sp. 2 PMI_412]